MARWRIRCSKEKCKMRFSLRKHPDDYQRQWKCAGCGGTQFRVIVNRPKDRCAALCTCGGYQWVQPWARGNAPHRRGSRFCYYRKDGTLRQPGDEDFEDPNYEAEALDAA